MGWDYTKDQGSMMESMKTSTAPRYEKEKRRMKAELMSGPSTVKRAPGPSPLDEARVARLRRDASRQATGNGGFRRPSTY